MYITKKTYLTITSSQGNSVDLTEAEVAALKAELLSMPSDWRILALAERKIDAIKVLREKRGLGLKEAKDVVEDYMARQAVVEDDVCLKAQADFRKVQEDFVCAPDFKGERI